MEARSWVAVGRLVKRYREENALGQTAVAEMLSRELPDYPIKINQGLVTRNEAGGRFTPDLAGGYARVLGIPDHEMREAMYGPNSGFTAEDERPARRQTWREVIEADSTLSDAAKAHLINQYGLLQLATLQERSGRPLASEEELRRQAE